jgi:predicted homoserine dehydrogenase-like protein
MNLHRLLQQRAAQGRPVRVGVIGCGKFASMYLTQASTTPGLHVLGIADLAPARAIENLKRVGWTPARYGAKSLGAAVDQGTTHLGDDVAALVRHPAVDVIVEATGHPPAGVRHALMAIAAKKHVVMVTVEADAFVGPLLARKAAEAGVIYSLAYGDQPALICDLVDWARASGFAVTAAGRGHKWLPKFAQSTPDTVWENWGLSAEQARIGGMNPRMFNSFLDGTKPAIESTAVANATGLTPAPDGLTYPPCATPDLAEVMRPRAEGGMLDRKGQVEVVSSLRPDGSEIADNLRWGVWVVFEAPNEYSARCFREYGLATDRSGRYASMYKRWHLIGLELGISVAAAALRGEATGCATGFRADAVAMAKKDMNQGDVLDGEGGYTVSGKLLPAAASLKLNALPIGLAHNVTLKRPVKQGAIVTWADVAADESDDVVRFRREMERVFAAEARRRAAE